MDNMFYDCSNLGKLDLTNFNSSNVTDMSFMFYGCINLMSLTGSFTWVEPDVKDAMFSSYGVFQVTVV